MACSYQRRPPFWTGLGVILYRTQRSLCTECAMTRRTTISSYPGCILCVMCDGNTFPQTIWERETEGDKGRQRETEGDKGRRRETKGDRGRQRVIVGVRPSSTNLLLSQGKMGADIALNHSIWYEFVPSEDQLTCETE